MSEPFGQSSASSESGPPNSGQPNPAPPNPAPPASKETSTLIIAAAVALVIGLVIGAAAGQLLFAGNTGGSAESRAEQDVIEGCAILDRIGDELPLDEDSTSISEPVLFELLGAGHLFMAAVRADESYEKVGELGQTMVSGVSRLETDELNEAITGLQSECADR